MNIGKLFVGFFERLGIVRGPRIKKIVIRVAAIMSILIVFIIVFNKQSNKNPTLTKVSLMPKEAKPKKELNYEFIKFDTIKITNFPPAEKQEAEISKELKALSLAENTSQSRTEVKKPKKSIESKISRVKSMLVPKPTSNQTRGVNNNPNMIVMNNLAKNPVSNGSSPATFTGRQSALVKVVLPDRTPVANGSVVVARVLKDSKWGNVFIPKRTKLIGIASLFNRRVNIEFQEIVINNVNRSCSGRAYDLKRLQGLPYSPVNSETRRVLLEELRDAVTGVPVVGRLANRATSSSNYYNQDVSELDEGLEFYILINSIF